MSRLARRVFVDDTSRRDAADDFGHLVHRLPLAVVCPSSVEEIVAVVDYASRRGIKVAMNGNSHSVHGQAQVEDGIVMLSRGLGAIHDIGESHANVDAGVTWGQLAKATIARGLTPPVMAEFQDLSIGGTLSVGGVGPSSHRFGAQVDHVLELEVVTGTGERVRCSRDQRRELFDAVLAGFGQFGLIARAVIRLVPAPERVVFQDVHYGDLQAYLSDFGHVLRSDAFDHQLGDVTFEAGRPRFRLQVGRFFSSATPPTLDLERAELPRAGRAEPSIESYWDYLNRRASATRGGARWRLPHATLYLFLPAAQTQAFLAHVLADPGRYEGADHPTLFGVFPLDPKRFQCPLFRVPRGDEQFFAIYLFRAAAADATAGAAPMVESNRRLYERARGAGGTLYPVSAVPLGPRDWEPHFGPELWRDVSRAKGAFDPNGILTPGPAMFGAQQ